MKRILLYGLIIAVLVVSTLGFASTQPLNAEVDVNGTNPAIQLVKSVNATTIYSGDDVQYTLNVTNIGDTTLYNVTVVDDTLDFVLDPVIGPITLVPGESNVAKINVTIAGNGTLTNIANAIGTTLLGTNVTDTDTVTVTVFAQEMAFPAIESCDSAGVKKDTFGMGEDVYVNGTGFANSTIYSLYVVEDQAGWSDGMTIPPRVSGTATTVFSDAEGNVLPTLAWSDPLVPGKYDVVVDVNGNGKYDVNIDAIDDNDIMITAGFFVIPEVPLGTIMASAAMIIGLACYYVTPKVRKKKVNLDS